MIVLTMALPGDYLVAQGAFPGHYVTLLSDDYVAIQYDSEYMLAMIPS
jgi:hypothetical protein